MKRKVTVVAPANIALIKYWGMRDRSRILPSNPSLSMTLSRCVTRTSVEFDSRGSGEEVWLAAADGSLARAKEAFSDPAARHLRRIRRWAGVSGGLRMATENRFPTAAGIASSASGFAALTLAAVGAVGRSLTPPELSVLARRSGSGSAARSVFGGYVQWPGDPADPRSGAEPIAAAGHWELRDVIVVVDSGAKEISSREGHSRAGTSPHFSERQRRLPERLQKVRRAIESRSFEQMAPAVEEEAVELHLIAMSSRPPIFYWRPGTLAVLAAVCGMRERGLAVCATMDAGPNVHLICTAEAEKEVARGVESLPGVREIIRDRVGEGPYRTEEHLF